jgi:transcriptional regulator with XRE-family HTH domain
MSAVPTAPRASQILLVGQKIRQIRKSRHLTQSDLASRIGVTQSDLSRMENGEYKVGLDTLFRILQVFELSMSRFFEEPSAASQETAAAAEAVRLEDEADDVTSDLAALPEDSRREVREFIAFKKMQAEARRRGGSGERGESSRAGLPANDDTEDSEND